MAIRYLTVGEIINDVTSAILAQTSSDPVGDGSDKGNQQLVTLLNIGIEELSTVEDWQQHRREHSFTTNAATYPDGRYPLPDDFDSMIPQTQWDQTNNQPVTGPLSSQQWQYLKGYDLVSSTIYASFRQIEGILEMWPTPPPDGLVVAFEYRSTNWIQTGPYTYAQRISSQGDIVLLPPTLIRSYLAAKYRESKGFGSVNAARMVANFLDGFGGKDEAAPVLSTTSTSRFPYLDPRRNVGDTGFGVS